MASTSFKIGDRVAIRGGSVLDRDRLRLGTVKRVMKRFVELEDGSQFTHEGGDYPRREYTFTRLLALTPEVKAEARRQSFIRFLFRVEWGELETGTLAKIVSLVREKPLEAGDSPLEAGDSPL
jgi:hypothetical protein